MFHFKAWHYVKFGTTAFKKCEGAKKWHYGLWKTDYIPSNFSKTVFHKFYLVHSWNFVPFVPCKPTLNNMLVCRHPGLFFRVHPAGRKNFYNFEMEKKALILIYFTRFSCSLLRSTLRLLIPQCTRYHYQFSLL